MLYLLASKFIKILENEKKTWYSPILFIILDKKKDKRTVSIKRTVYNFSQMTLLNVLYDLKNEIIIS